MSTLICYRHEPSRKELVLKDGIWHCYFCLKEKRLQVRGKRI